MDIEAFARTSGLASCVLEVRAWRRELSDTSDGLAVRRNLRRDTQLESSTRGRATLRRLVRRLAARASDSPSAGSPWLKQVLEDRHDEFLGQGRTVRRDTATDLVARATPLRSVATYLVRPRVLTTTDPVHLRRWARRFLTDPIRARSVVNATAMVRGVLPFVFACPDADRERHWQLERLCLTSTPCSGCNLRLPSIRRSICV